MGRAKTARPWVLGLAALSVVVPLAACGSEFEYTIGRQETDTRVGAGTGLEAGGPVPSQEALLQLQEDSAKKVEAAKADKGGG